MPKIQIDGVDYDTDTLNEEAKKQLGAMRLIDGEISRLQLQMGIANTARSVHAQLLKAALANPLDGDTIKLG